MGNKLTQLRQLNGSFARSYKYNFTFTPQAGASALIALVSKYGNTNGDISTLLSAACVNCVIPNTGNTEIVVEVGMHSMRLNGRNETSGTSSPEFIISGEYTLHKFLRAWKALASNDENDNQEANYQILADISIQSMGLDGKEQEWTKLKNAWVRNCPEINYSDDSNDVIRFVPEFAYDIAVPGEPV